MTPSPPRSGSPIQFELNLLRGRLHYQNGPLWLALMLILAVVGFTFGALVLAMLWLKPG